MECSGSQGPKELPKSPPSGQAQGERSGQRLRHSLRLGGLAFECYFGGFPPRLHCLPLYVSVCAMPGLWYSVPLRTPFSFSAAENPAELRPKNTLGGQRNESMFLLRFVKRQSGEASRDGR